MDTTQAAEALGVTPKHLRVFLRRVRRALGEHVGNDNREHYEFDAEQFTNLRQAYGMSARRSAGYEEDE